MVTMLQKDSIFIRLDFVISDVALVTIPLGKSPQRHPHALVPAKIIMVIGAEKTNSGAGICGQAVRRYDTATGVGKQ